MEIPQTVLDILKVAAPTLATALGGPLAGVAASVATKALAEYLGPAPALVPGSTPAAYGAPQPTSVGAASPVEIVDVVLANASNPALFEALKKAELDLQRFQEEQRFKFAELDVRDRESARKLGVDSGLSDRIFVMGRWVIWSDVAVAAAIIVGGFLLLSGIVPLRGDPTLVTVIFTLFGAIIGRISSRADQVSSYYFGSSKSSTDKTSEITTTMRDMGAALGSAAQKALPAPAPVPGLPAPTPVTVTVQPPAAVIPPLAEAPDEKPTPSRFGAVVARLQEIEGGYVDDPRDSGGCTNRGVTIGTLRDWRGDLTLTCEDIKALTWDEAVKIYRTRYWNAAGCDQLPCGVDWVVFDIAVNAGVRRAGEFLQRIVAKFDATIAVDGIIGPLTIAAARKIPPAQLIEMLYSERMEHYRSLGEWSHFGRGWTARADRVLAEARSDVSMAGA